MGLLWETYQKQSANPLTGQSVAASRRRVRRELELPMKDAYDLFIRSLLEQQSESSAP